MLKRDQPLAIFMQGAMRDTSGKMGFGILRYSPNPIACVIDAEHAGQDAAAVTGIDRHAPIVASVDEAVVLGAQAFVLGIAPLGGKIPADWYATIDQAVSSGLSIINGLHDRLEPRYPSLRDGQFVWDIRVEPAGLGSGQGKAAQFGNRRLLMIGTDMSVGKMTAGLEIFRVARERGIDTEFVATGQIGITITGAGVPLDAIRVDYASGSIEREMLRVKDAGLIVVEGQGSLAHPGSTATLPLLRGSCPTHLICCVRAGQTHLQRAPHIAIPPLREFIRLYEDLATAAGAFPRPQCVAIAANTSAAPSGTPEEWLKRLSDETGLPAADPLLPGGPERLLDAVLA